MDSDDPTPWDLLASGERWASPSDLTTDRYAERGPLGGGGMGEVVVAEDVLLHRKVALKRALGDPNGPEAQRLRREARITAALDHPGIVPVHDVGEDADGHPHYVMRLVRGESLEERLRTASTPAGRRALLRPLLAAVDAVAYAHDAGVIHRDLKPDNIMVGPWGETQVMDWGLARASDSDAWERILSQDFRTRTGTVLGTPAYMSPEQASGGEVGPPADVWALGAILYEVLSGERMVRGSTDKEMLAQILSGSRSPLSEAAPDLEPAWVSVVDRALEGDPGQRFSDAGALAGAMRAVLDAGAEPSRRPPWTWPVVLAVVLVAAAGGWWFARSTPPPSPPSEDVALVQRGLVLEAQRALSLGNTVEAASLARDALSRGDHPGARGILAAANLAPRLEKVDAFALSGCDSVVQAPKGGFLLCRGADHLVRYDADGTQRWRVPFEAARVLLDGVDGTIAAQPLGQPTRWHHLEAETGHEVTFTRLEFDAPGGRQGLSERPGSFVRLMNGRFNEFGVATAKHHERVRWFDACEDRGGVEFAVLPASGPPLAICTDHAVVEVGSDRVVVPATDRDAITWCGASNDARDLLLLGEVEGDLRLVDLGAGTQSAPFSFTPRMVRSVALSGTGDLGAMVDSAGVAWVFQRTDPAARVRVPGEVKSLAFSGEDELLVVRRERAERWRVPTLRWTRRPVPEGVIAIDWSGEGLAVMSSTVTVFDPSGRERAELPRNAIRLPRFSDDVRLRSVQWMGEELVLSGHFAGAWMWSVEDAPRLVSGQAGAAVGLRSGRLLLLGTPGSDPKHVSLQGERIDGPWLPGWVGHVGQASRSGEHALLKGRPGSPPVVVEDGDPPTLTPRPDLEQASTSVLSEGGERIYSLANGSLYVRGALAEPSDARRIAEGLGGSLAVDPSEEYAFVGTPSGEVLVLALDSGAERMRIEAHTRRVSAMAISPDGTELVTGSWDRTLARWDLGPLRGADDVAAAPR